MSYPSLLSWILVPPNGPLPRLVVFHQRSGITELVRHARRRFVNLCARRFHTQPHQFESLSERKLTFTAHFRQFWNERTNILARRIDLRVRVRQRLD